MNPWIHLLQPYPFEKLSTLFKGTTPAEKKAILWSIGEPKHEAPAFVREIINREIGALGSYPLTAGSVELREAIRDWLLARFQLSPDSIDRDRHIVPVNGTREALFAFCHFIVDPRRDNARVLMPNPFYQIYEGAALLAGATPWYMNLRRSDMLPDLDAIPEEILRDCQLIYICSPGNPAGAVMGAAELQKLINLSDRFNFVIASDECYSEIYPDESAPPCGLLQAASQMGRHDYRNCVIFQSLSKRSSLPGMRSGFVAGDEEIIKKFKLYRTYHGCAMSPPFQKVSSQSWRDEDHVKENRSLYRQKFESVCRILSGVLDLKQPDGTFYLWAQTPFADTDFARMLYAEQNLTVLPGSFLSRKLNGVDPGRDRVRMALVAPLSECVEGAERLKEFLEKRRSESNVP
jgi:N-succinyldiaminopimelate aminotransferase